MGEDDGASEEDFVASPAQLVRPIRNKPVANNNSDRCRRMAHLLIRKQTSALLLNTANAGVPVMPKSLAQAVDDRDNLGRSHGVIDTRQGVSNYFCPYDCRSLDGIVPGQQH